MNLTEQEHRAIAERLRAALRDGELSLYWQPQVDVERGYVPSAEALIRWTDKETHEDRTAQHVKADEVSFSLRYHTVRATKATRSNNQAHEADDTREG